jgi:hypothetical protein
MRITSLVFMLAAHHDDVLAALKARRPAAAQGAIKRDIGETTKSLLRSSIFRATMGGLSGSPNGSSHLSFGPSRRVRER